MAWIPSHQELKDHPKTRRAARMAGVSVPTMIGHLHLLWHWALDHAPDGNISRYDPIDLADAAMWEGDADLFVKALADCGPGTDAGFIADGSLHDWDEYGGRYQKRSDAGRKAAEVRWHSGDDANALPPASESQSDCNTERELDLEEKEKTIVAVNGSSASPPTEDVRLVFAAWVESTGRDPTRTKLTPDRRGLIKRRLQTYPVADLVAAVKGWKHDPHLRGENDRQKVYNDLDLLLRDAKHIESLRDLEHGCAPEPIRAGPKEF